MNGKKDILRGVFLTDDWDSNGVAIATSVGDFGTVSCIFHDRRLYQLLDSQIPACFDPRDSIGPAIVPGHMITFWLWIALRQIEAIETHSGYDFHWNPTRFIPFYGGVDYHDYHHYVGGQSQSNFASVFTYCDYIYGTDKLKEESRIDDAHNGGSYYIPTQS
ncbi:hypothetical protein CRYUN_Cryun19dG0135900 [Craigia yunnanensis]